MVKHFLHCCNCLERHQAAYVSCKERICLVQLLRESNVKHPVETYDGRNCRQEICGMRDLLSIQSSEDFNFVQVEKVINIINLDIQRGG